MDWETVVNHVQSRKAPLIFKGYSVQRLYPLGYERWMSGVDMMVTDIHQAFQVYTCLCDKGHDSCKRV
jgi:hypothetical protein